MRNLAVVLFAAAMPLLNAGTESKWKVMKGAAQLGTVTLLTSSSAARAEWKTGERGVSEVFIGTGGKSWMRTTGGDIDIATLSSTVAQRDVAQALLVPFGATTGLELKSGKPASYMYAGNKASYAYDDKGVSTITIKAVDKTYTLTRTSLTSSTADASNFTVRPRKNVAGLLARDLLGPSDTSVASTAGGRGVGTKGLRLSDGGDYDAVAKLENRDANWSNKLDKALADFQKSGKVGRGRAGE